MKKIAPGEITQEVMPLSVYKCANDDMSKHSNHFNGILKFPYGDNEEKDKKNFSEVCRTAHTSGHFFKDNKRSSENWLGAQCIIIDCDDGITIEEAKEKLEDLQVRYFMAPSRSHRKEKNGKVSDRFHVYIPLSEKIEVPSVYKYNFNYWCDILKGDKQCSDLARIIARNPFLLVEQVELNTKYPCFTPMKKHLNAEKDEKRVEERKAISKASSVERSSDLDARLTWFIHQVKNMHPVLKPATYNHPTSGCPEGSMNFYRDSNDQQPRVVAMGDNNYIRDITLKKNYPIVYPLNNILRIKKCDSEKVRNDIKSQVLAYMKENDAMHENDPRSTTIRAIMANEGTGKSLTYSAPEIIRPGNILLFTTKVRVREQIAYYERDNIPHNTIYSNADLIHNCVFFNRYDSGEQNEEECRKQAEEIQGLYENMFSKTSDDDLTPEMKKEIDERYQTVGSLSFEEKLGLFVSDVEQSMLAYNEKEFDFHKKAKKTMAPSELKTIFADKKLNKSIASIMMFLEDIGDKMWEGEAEFIMSEYVRQLFDFRNGKSVCLMTVAKFKAMLKQGSSYIENSGRHVFIDEFDHDSFDIAEVLDKYRHADRYLPAKIYIEAKQEAQKMGVSLKDIIIKYHGEKVWDKIEYIMDKKNVEEWIESRVWGGKSEAIIEIHYQDWIRVPGLHYFVYGTESSIPLMLNDYITDWTNFSHKIAAPKMKIIITEGLSQYVNKELQLQGKARILAAKHTCCEMFDIPEENFIADSVGHSSGTNGYLNHTNVKGLNSFRARIANSGKKQNVGIFIASPNPTKIHLYKGYLYSYFKNQAEKENISFNMHFNSDEIEEAVKSCIVCEQAQQSLGRCLGYRDEPNVENVFMIVNTNLASYLDQLNYVTPHVITKAGLDQSKDNQKKYPLINSFLEEINRIFHIKKTQDIELNEEELREWLRKQKPDKNQIIKKMNSIKKSIDQWLKKLKQDDQSPTMIRVLKNTLYGFVESILIKPIKKTKTWFSKQIRDSFYNLKQYVNSLIAQNNDYILKNRCNNPPHSHEHVLEAKGILGKLKVLDPNFKHLLQNRKNIYILKHKAQEIRRELGQELYFAT